MICPKNLGRVNAIKILEGVYFKLIWMEYRLNFSIGGGDMHMNSMVGGRKIKRQDEWWKDNWRSQKWAGYIYAKQNKGGVNIMLRPTPPIF